MGNVARVALGGVTVVIMAAMGACSPSDPRAYPGTISDGRTLAQNLAIDGVVLPATAAGVRYYVDDNRSLFLKFSVNEADLQKFLKDMVPAEFLAPDRLDTVGPIPITEKNWDLTSIKKFEIYGAAPVNNDEYISITFVVDRDRPDPVVYLEADNTRY